MLSEVDRFFSGFRRSSREFKHRFSKTGKPSLDLLETLGIMTFGDDCAVIGDSMVCKLPS